MSYVWKFKTSGKPAVPVGRQCHRGPMIDIEVVMAVPFTVMTGVETLRKLLLEQLVDINLVAVQTRECILRTLNSNVGPLFTTVNPRFEELKVLICEKKNSIVIDQALSPYDFQFKRGVESLEDYGVTSMNVKVLLDALESSSAILRVAARCAFILSATLVEMS